MNVSESDEAALAGEMAPRLDEYGHLVDAMDWSPRVARWLAARDGIVLGDQHWRLIEVVREYHLRHGNPPLMRTLIAALQHSLPAGASSRELYRLFPEGPVRLACKYGGLPPPDWCL